MEYFSSTFADLPGSFLRTCLKQLFYRESVSTWSSTADVIPGVLQNFKNMQGWRLQFKGFQFTIEKLHYKVFPGYFPKLSKLSDLIRCSFLIALKPAGCKSATLIKREFLKTCGRALFRNNNLRDRVLNRIVECRKFFCFYYKSGCYYSRFPAVFPKFSDNSLGSSNHCEQEKLLVSNLSE